jgi:hypothetical protein
MPPKGTHHNDATKKKISKRLMGHPVSEETRQKMSSGLKGNPAWNKGKPCNEEQKLHLSAVLKGRSSPRKGIPLALEHVNHISGPNASNWRGGVSFKPYCPKFNERFREGIREKFNRTCYLCPATEKENGQRLCVHHIDYNKNSICNGQEWAFVPLCNRHHTKTNFDRWYWFNLLICYWALNPEINF